MRIISLAEVNNKACTERAGMILVYKLRFLRINEYADRICDTRELYESGSKDTGILLRIETCF